MNKRVGVIGAGLSGLSCAVELKKSGFDVEIFEQQKTVGGRVQTDDVEGFKLDHGFQVYLPAYEMGQKFFDYKNLELKGFQAGAKVFYKGTFYKIGDPLRSLKSLLPTLRSPFANLKDKILILKLKSEAAKMSRGPLQVNSQTTADYLSDFGFSKKFIASFFEPFFSGVFLETKLETPSSFFLYLFDKFSNSEASLPKNGMRSLVDQLVSEVNAESIHLGVTVKECSKNSIRLESGEERNFDSVVLAVDEPASLSKSIDFDVNFNIVTTYYFKTQSKDFASKFLFLNSEKNRLVNHVACLSAVQESYAPEGWELFSVNVVSEKEAELKDVLSDLCVVFGKEEIGKWTFLKSYLVKKALPYRSFYGGQSYKTKEGVYLCGDYMESPSIQGALSSGFKVAQEIVKI